MSIINCYDLNGMAIRFLTQWDHDVSIRITGVNADPIPEFRFSNKKSKKAICIKGIATSDSMMSIVPNELLREALPVYVQLFYEYPSGDAKTEHTFVIPVKPASMPDSEVYEPSEVKSLAEIEARLDRLERNGAPGSGGIPSNPTFDTICLWGDNGVVIIPEGTVSAPALTLYGAHGDEPVSLNNVADATDDRSVPNLGQVKRLMQQLEAVRLKVVHELPDSGEAMVLYLVPAQSSTDIYTEYLWVDGAWEVVGSQTLDLTGYATEDWVEDYVSTRLEEDSGQNVEIDTTLTQSGKAADAKAVGDALDKLEEKIPSIEGLAKTEDIPDVPSWAMQVSKPAYTASEVGALPNTYTPPNQTAAQVGADPKGTAESAVAEHNTATDAHNDIRVKLEELRQTLAHFFNATTPETMDQISELVSGIEANADLIAALTTGKVSVSSIVANLTTNLADRPLAASMGVELKKLIDQVSASLANYQPKGNYALESAVPTKVSQLQNDAKYLTAVTAAMITAALGYTPINPGLATLARHTDGLLYLFVDGKPVGSGVELPTGGIDGYVDADKNIVVRGLDEGVTYKFFFELADGSLVEGGELVYDNTVYYTVTNTLTNCTTNNSATQVIEGESYSATITAKSGYELKSVVVTMGGNPVTVSGGNINIASVSGNIVITAVAEVAKPAYTNFADPTSADWMTGYRLSGDIDGQTELTGGVVTNYVSVQQGDTLEVTGINIADGNSRTAFRFDSTNNSIMKPTALTSSASISGVSYDANSLICTVTASCDSDARMRFSGLATGTSEDVVIKIKRNGAYL